MNPFSRMAMTQRHSSPIVDSGALARAVFFRIAVLLAGFVLSCDGHAQGAAPSAQTLQETRQLLDWLGVSAVLEQAPLALSNSLEAEGRFRQANAQQVALWRRQLVAQFKLPAMQQELLRYVAERYQADAFQHATRQLQEPLARRVRFFELATSQPSAVRGLRDFREELKKVESDHDPAQASTEKMSARRNLVRALDTAAGTSALAAALQTYIEESVRRSAGADPADPERLRAEMAERQRYLAPFAEDYLLYAYRYLKDDELAAYRELLADAQMQWLLNICEQGLIATLQNAD